MKSKKEKWVNCYKAPQNYEVSDYGRVRNKKTKKILKLHLSRDGYLRCGLSVNGKTEVVGVNRLVYLSFYPNTPHYLNIHHLDHNKTNNKLSNLGAIDQKTHASMHARLRVLMGTLNYIAPPEKGINNPICKGYVVALCPLSSKIKHIMAGSSEMLSLGFDPRGVHKVVNGMRKKYRGFAFKRVPNNMKIKVGQIFNEN
jgi:hypothetical protein